MHMKLLEGKTAVITGGAAGIGKAASIKFLEEGANVAVWDFDETKAMAWMENHPAYNSSLIFCKVDTSNAEMVENAKNETMSKFGNIEILLNNAGITRDSTLLKMSFDLKRFMKHVSVMNLAKKELLPTQLLRALS